MAGAVGAGALPGGDAGEGEGWAVAVPLQAAMIAVAAMEYSTATHLLRPAVIPPQLDRAISGVAARHVSSLPDFADDGQPFAPASHLADELMAWQEGSLSIPAHSIRRVLLQFDDYYSFYYAINVSDGCGARLRIATAERLFGPRREGPPSHGVAVGYGIISRFRFGFMMID